MPNFAPNSVNSWKPREYEREFYSVEEARQMLTLLKDESRKRLPFAVFFTLAVYTGCRKGELLGLEWKDVDFDNAVISINRAYYYSRLDRACYTDTPKTATSKRSLKLPGHVMDTLKGLQAWQNEQREICGGSWVERDRLFTDLRGEPMTPYAPNYFFSEFCKRHGTRRVKIHSFRHFNASVLINSGVDVVTVQAALGHSQASTTLNIYSHSFNNAKTRAMEAISAAVDL